MEQKDEERMQQEGIRQALASLDERSRRVIMARWLNVDDNGNNTPKTLQELAQELGVSAELHGVMLLPRSLQLSQTIIRANNCQSFFFTVSPLTGYLFSGKMCACLSVAV